MVQVTNDHPWPTAAHLARRALLEKIPENVRLDIPYWQAKYPPGSDVRNVATECGFMTAEELEITDTSVDACEILGAIKARKWSAQQVCIAFGKRACIAHQMITCLSAIFIDEAIARAKELDEYYTRTGNLVGPLHGLPIDIKEHYRMKGHRSTMSTLSRLDVAVEQSDNSILTILRNAGAIFYVKSNLPQLGMHLETYSFWGETINPFNTCLTPGGSSGGGSALMAFGGAPLSLGGDIGGSLRAPAAACGLWTLKPNTQRMPRERESAGPSPKWDTITGSNGPLARSLRDCHLFFKVILDAKPWLSEQSLVPIPWRKSLLPGCKKPLRIGVMAHDGIVLPQPPTRRALEALTQVLALDKNLEIVEFKPYKHAVGVALAHELYFPDNAKDARSLLKLSKEPILPLTEWVMSRQSVKAHSVEEYSELLLRRNAYRSEYLEYMNACGVDVILCPASYGPAQALGTTKYWGYTCIFNLLDYPAAVFPTGLIADAQLDPMDDVRVFMSEEDEYAANIYNPQHLSGAPLGLQLVGRRFHEEDLMAILGVVAAKLPLQN